MKRILLSILGILLLAGCGKGQSIPAYSEADQDLDLRSGKVQKLHYTSSDYINNDVLYIIFAALSFLFQV